MREGHGCRPRQRGVQCAQLLRNAPKAGIAFNELQVRCSLAMGTTYDQRRLWDLGVFGMVGNKDRARQWYQRADELGHPEAKARITALQ